MRYRLLWRALSYNGLRYVYAAWGKGERYFAYSSKMAGEARLIFDLAG
jgi:hypothetical protein